MSELKLKDGLLVKLVVRMIEASGKATTRHYAVCPQDPTSAEKITAYAFLQEGIGKGEKITDCSNICNRDDFGNHYPEGNEKCAFCANFLPDVAKECEKFSQNGGQWELPVGPQIVEIEITSIWGTEITVSDVRSGETLMVCYFSGGSWYPRKTSNKPQDALRSILWDAEFLTAEEAKEMEDNWTDDEWWAFRDGYDPMGCASDYE